VQPKIHPPQVVYACSQPQYIPLPVIQRKDGIITCRWHMTWRERMKALLHGDVYVQINTHNNPLQPIRVYIDPPVPYSWYYGEYVSKEE
jgi:hypothetical protein